MVFTRTTILRQEDADPPRTLSQLAMLQSVGAVLNKPQWWLKWSNRPEIRRRWLKELEKELLQLRMETVASHWPREDDLQEYTQKCLVQVCLAAVAIPDAAAREGRVRRLTAAVPYPPSSYQNYTYLFMDQDERWWGQTDEPGYCDYVQAEEDLVVFKSVEGEIDEANEENDSYSTTYGDEQEGDEGSVRTHRTFPYRRKEPFGQILWYMKMRGFHESLRDMPLEEWTREELGALADEVCDRHNPIAMRRAIFLISEILRCPDPPTVGTVDALLDEPREYVVKILWYFCHEIYNEFQDKMAEIAETLDTILVRLKRPDDDQAGDSQCSIGTPGPAPHTWIGDGIIPANVKTAFIKQVAKLENVPDGDKDWHPNSNKQVLDLVHPSLYCVMNGTTKYLSKDQLAELDYDSPISHLQQIMTVTPRERAAHGVDSISHDDFQWIPSEVDVSEDGTSAKFVTYINNLHPVIHAPLYDTISTIFGRFVPLFNRVLSSLKDGDSDIVPPAEATYKLDGSRCQVIVKIAEIHLTPENPRYEGGSWHVEGTESEQIIGTGLYYFGSENITESRLSFRTIVQAPPYQQNDQVGVGLKYGFVDDELLVQWLGSLTAIEDRCVVFPNLYQHRVEPFQLRDSTRPGMRKILAFFLVNPSKPVLSTAVVPPQQQEWMDLAREPFLKRARHTGDVQESVRDIISEGMTLEEAKKHRLELMSKRAYVDDYKYECRFSLCEH